MRTTTDEAIEALNRLEKRALVYSQQLRDTNKLLAELADNLGKKDNLKIIKLLKKHAIEVNELNAQSHANARCKE